MLIYSDHGHSIIRNDRTIFNIEYAAVGEGGIINYTVLAIYDVGEIKKIGDAEAEPMESS